MVGEATPTFSPPLSSTSGNETTVCNKHAPRMAKLPTSEGTTGYFYPQSPPPMVTTEWWPADRIFRVLVHLKLLLQPSPNSERKINEKENNHIKRIIGNSVALVGFWPMLCRILAPVTCTDIRRRMVISERLQDNDPQRRYYLGNYVCTNYCRLLLSTKRLEETTR